MQVYFMKKIFPPLFCITCKEEKDASEYKKALKSHMKIENITSVHNYSMLHITCSTKSQMTLCPSVPDMPISWKGQMYWDIYFRGSLHTRLRQGLEVFKVNLTWNALIIMGVSACPHCDAHYGLVFVFFSHIFRNTESHPAACLCCCFFCFFFKLFCIILYSQFWFNEPKAKQHEEQKTMLLYLSSQRLGRTVSGL